MGNNRPIHPVGHQERIEAHTLRVQAELEALGRRKVKRTMKFQSRGEVIPGVSSGAPDAFREWAFQKLFQQSKIRDPLVRFMFALGGSLQPIRDPQRLQHWYDTHLCWEKRKGQKKPEMKTA